MSVYSLSSWTAMRIIEGYPHSNCVLSKEYTYYYFRQLDPKNEQDRKVYFKTTSGIHYFEFKKKYESVRSRWRKMSKISEQKGFIGWVPTTQKIARKLKLKMLKGDL